MFLYVVLIMSLQKECSDEIEIVQGKCRILLLQT